MPVNTFKKFVSKIIEWKKYSLSVSLLLSFLLFYQPAYPQKGKNKNNFQTMAAHGQLDSISVMRSEYQFQFKNINVIPFYYNEAEFTKIKKLEEAKNYKELLPLMERYVNSFGIQNFSRNTDMIWKLGRLYQMFGYKDRALFLYRTALKNLRGKRIEEIKKYYDTITASSVDQFVPLEYYYQLVDYRKAVDTLYPPKSVFLNMGELVNDLRYPDYGPTMNVDGNMLIFTKRKKVLTPTKLTYRENEDLYFTMNYDGFWDEALPFSNVINSNCNEGSATISRNGRTLYFARCIVPDYLYDCRDCMGSCDIYESHLDDDGKWSVAQNLGIQVNSISWDSHPTLSHTEDTLYFASDRIGGFGLSDIWFTYKLPKGGWAQAQNMGPVINTRGNEVSPFYHPIHDVFYFSSNGHLLNFGKRDSLDFTYHTYDIYKSRMLEKKWQEPKNIGPLVNGPGDEYYFTIDSKSRDLFYSKSEIDNLANLELFSFPLPMEAQPLAYTKLKGSLTDSLTNEPFTGIVSVIDLTNGIEVAPKFMREDGTFEFDLNNENDYLLVIQGDDFFRIEHNFKLDGDTVINLKTNSIKYNKWKFTSLEFDNNSSKILPEMEGDLDKVVDFLVDHPQIKLVISGHTDGSGDAAANLRLSQARADAIKSYIMEKGNIDESRIEAVGYGNQKPIIQQEVSESDRKINRRVEFELIRSTTIEEEKVQEEIEIPAEE
ncbi:OmpA family protein [Cytophaga hutchinsonii]|uniref:Possible outer membrane protein n=1 Tax=Cytophaga hutchinsonii (strain ATCC 33406 / DSM 1761 / CIP 103989 / NBRC 15051 / NCIMB 9469 / D465) TaxID=269798 RepID=A0A6N4SV01_CYTH3|nr:OmpA family protein [Cytophaga hutchinsonii]ABG60234.1 possible outer membrane protein [Cytophaga hutchinsonii ATCC 33406]SFX21187.1 OmpA family protein [Cytophaga hutchinsonii ATCC 33406]